MARADRRGQRVAPIAVGDAAVVVLVLGGATREPAAFDVTVRAAPDDRTDVQPELEPPFAPGRTVLVTRPGVIPRAYLAGLDLALADGVHGVNVARTGGTSADAEQIARTLAERFPGLVCCEPDVLALLPGSGPEGSQSNRIVVGSEFGRREFDTQSALRMLHARGAHRVADGEDTVVAVLDTGIDVQHALFAGRLEAGYDFVDDDADPSEQLDAIDSDDDGETSESYGHGTFVAGLVLAAAPGARILPVRVLDDDGRGTAAGVASGIYHAVDRGADVINLSLGTQAYSQVLAGAVRYARQHGVPIVAAAGNDGSRWIVDFPGTEPGVLSVTSLDASGRRSEFANGRKSNTVAAPGRGLIGPYPGGLWGKGSGTSFSTALVSGGAALLRAAHPELGDRAAERRLQRPWKIDLRRLVR